MKQAIKQSVHSRPNWHWFILAGGLFLPLMMLTLVIVLRPSPIATLQGDLADHFVTTLVAIFFCLLGIVVFLRIDAVLAACIAYGVFVCASLIFCLLNISFYSESVMVMSLLSAIAHGLATTFVCQLAFPTGWSIRWLRISPYTPLVLSLALCSIYLPTLLLFPSQWPVTALLIYVFPFVCLVIINWGIFSHLQQAAVSNRSLDGTALLGMVFVLLSLSIVNGKSTPYHITYLPSTVGFLIFYAFFVACFALFTGTIFWIWQRMLLRLLRIVVPMICIGAFLLLVLGVQYFSNGNFIFFRTALENLFAYHLLSVPLLVLPIVASYALIYHQLSDSIGLLSRHFIRGTLWFFLASCFVISEIIVSVLAVQHWEDHSEITLICVCWLFLVCWLFPLMWSKIRDIGDRMFYRDFYHYNRTLRELSLALTRLRELNQICAFILPRLTKLLNAAGAALLVWPATVDPFQRWQCYQHEAIPDSIEAERFKISAQQATAHFTELSNEPQLVNNILVLPLYDGRSLRGCLCVGEKLNREPYSHQDKSFLETLAAQLAVLEANTRYLDQVYAHAQQILALNHRTIQAQEEERHRLALELHDDVLQQAMLLTRQLTDLSSDPRVAEALPLAHSITNSLRTTCLGLRPPLLDELGLPEALRWIAQQAEQQSGVRVMFQLCALTTPFQRLPNAVELALYRVSQEALTNAIKHADATLVRVRLRTNAEGVIALLIADNGHGLQRSRPLTSSLGLTGMIERMQAIGGKLYLRSSQGHGVVICALYRPPGGLPVAKDVEARAEGETYGLNF